MAFADDEKIRLIIEVGVLVPFIYGMVNGPVSYSLDLENKNSFYFGAVFGIY